MKKNNEKSGSVKIEPKVLMAAKKLCKERGYVVGRYVTIAVFEKNEREKQKETN